MSWTGFKKAVNRAGTQVMMKTGQLDQTIDREFDLEERRFRALESAAVELQKEARGYLDALRAMTSAQLRIAETIDVFYGESGTRDNVSKHYLEAIQDLDTQTVKELDSPYQESVLEPISRFCSYFGDINEAIKRRQHKLIDYDRLRHKSQRLIDNPPKDPSKLPLAQREEKAARDAFMELNDQLTAELPQLVDFRVPYLDPSFEALVKIQLRFCSEAYTRLADVQLYMEPQVRDEYANGQLDTYVEAALARMRDLSIVSI